MAKPPIICGVDITGWREVTVTLTDGRVYTGPIFDYTYPSDSPWGEPDIGLESEGLLYGFCESEIGAIERVA